MTKKDHNKILKYVTKNRNVNKYFYTPRPYKNFAILFYQVLKMLIKTSIKLDLLTEYNAT